MIRPNVSSLYTVIYIFLYFFILICTILHQNFKSTTPPLICCFYWSVLNQSGTILKNLGTCIHIHCTTHKRWVSFCRRKITMFKEVVIQAIIMKWETPTNGSFREVFSSWQSWSWCLTVLKRYLDVHMLNVADGKTVSLNDMFRKIVLIWIWEIYRVIWGLFEPS